MAVSASCYKTMLDNISENQMNITLFGCGAIGSQLALHLASPDIRFVLIDDDEVAEDNLATSAFLRMQVGVNKALALSNLLWRKNECPSEFHDITLTLDNYGKYVKSDLAIDCFDNVEARKITCKHLIPTLHVGVSRDGTGSITWDKDFKIFEGAPRGQDGFCTHLAGRGIIRLTAATAALIVEQFLANGMKQSLVVTERPNIIR